MTGCRIGKVTPKGNVRLLQLPPRLQCHNILDMSRRVINEETLAVVVTIIHKDRTVEAGCSYESGFTRTDLAGMMKRGEATVEEVLWPNNPMIPTGA